MVYLPCKSLWFNGYNFATNGILSIVFVIVVSIVFDNNVLFDDNDDEFISISLIEVVVKVS